MEEKLKMMAYGRLNNILRPVDQLNVKQAINLLNSDKKVAIPVLQTDEEVEYVLEDMLYAFKYTVEDRLIDSCFEYAEEICKLQSEIDRLKEILYIQETEYNKKLEIECNKTREETINECNKQLEEFSCKYNNMVEELNKKTLDFEFYRSRYRECLQKMSVLESKLNNANNDDVKVVEVVKVVKDNVKNNNKLSQIIIDKVIEYRNQGLGYRTIADMITNNNELIELHSKEYTNINGEVVNGSKHKFSISHTQVKKILDTMKENRTIINTGRRKKTTPEIEEFICNAEGTYSEIASKVWRDFGVKITTATIGNVKRRNLNV